MTIIRFRSQTRARRLRDFERVAEALAKAFAAEVTVRYVP
jgi:hypothetical protein